jgi:hypothetical protein
MDKNFCSTLGGLLHVIVFPTFSGGGLQNKMLVGYKKKLKCPFHGGFLSFFETPPTFVFWFSTIYYGIFLIHTFFG